MEVNGGNCAIFPPFCGLFCTVGDLTSSLNWIIACSLSLELSS